MAWKKKNKDLEEEFEDEYEDEYDDEEYEDEYEDDYDEDEYDDDYDDDDFDDEDEPGRNPLKGVVVVLVLLVLLLAAACALLYLRLQGAEAKVEKLNTALNAAQAELSRAQMQMGIAGPETQVSAVPENTAAPEAAPETFPEVTPEVTPEPVPEVTPEPTPEPTATPGPLPRDTTDEMLAGVYRPADNEWLPEARTAYANSYMVASHWGPGLGWTENLVLYQNDKVDVLALYGDWSLLRTQNNKYGWVLSTLLTDKAPA